jgi:ankyrin repeat protein
VNDVNNDGETVLMESARAGRLNQVQLLLARGANARLKDKKGLTALDKARIATYRDFTGELLPERADAARKQAEADLQEIKRLLARVLKVPI